MEPTLWEKIVLAFQYNDATWHNVFLTIIYILAGVFAVLFLVSSVRTAVRPRDIRDAPPVRNRKPILIVWISGVFGLLAFPVGLFLLLTVVLGSSDSARIESGTLAYERDGVQASVVLVDKFLTSSTDEGITSGTNKAYVYAIDTRTGLPIWKTSIGRAYTPALLGQTEERIVARDRTGPVVLNKSDGSQAADAARLEADNAELQGKLPEEADRYRWDDAKKQVVAQGLDGNLYAIDPDTLKGGLLSGAKLADYFGDGSDAADDRSPERIGLIRSGADDGRYALFLSDEEAAAAKDGTIGEEEPSGASATADPRKLLYIGSLLKDGKPATSDLEPLLDTVFLNGGFLSDVRLDVTTSADPYVMTEFPAFATLEKQPEMPEIPASFDWPSRMTMDEYEKYQAEETRRMDEYYAARDRYDEESEAYRERDSAYGAAARALLRLGSPSDATPFHFTEENGGSSEIFLVVHDAVVSNSPGLLLSAVDLQGGNVLWTADTKLRSIDGYDRSGDKLALVGRGEGGNSYLMTVSLEDGGLAGYDFRYDRSLKF